MTASFQERRTRPRLEPPRELYVEADLGPDQCTTAQVLDSSGNGMRLLFRPAIAIDPGMAIEVRCVDDAHGDRATVQWCHHKRSFTVAGIRACAERFTLVCTVAAPV